MVGIGSRSVYRALEHEQLPSRERRHRTHHVVDPYLPYLSRRWNEGCHTALALYEEIVTQGYTGSLRTIERIVAQFRPHGTKLVSSRTITLQKVPSARSIALMIVRPAEHQTQPHSLLSSARVIRWSRPHSPWPRHLVSFCGSEKVHNDWNTGKSPCRPVASWN